MQPRMKSRTLVSLFIGALLLVWVPETSAQGTSRSSSRGGISKSWGGARYHRQNPGEDWYRESLEAENERLEEKLQEERRKRWEDEDEEEEVRGPSGGPACIYAADGTVVFAPRGKRCGPASAAANAAPAPTPTPRPRRVQPQSETRKPTGSCMMGPNGTVLYAPPGVDCGR